MPDYFDKTEFECPCCGKDTVDDELVSQLNKARHEAGVPFIITSGVRCADYNHAIGGAVRSPHVLGLAADIRTPDSRTRYSVIQALLRVGFTRLGIYDAHVHADIGGGRKSDHSQQVIWTGKSK